MGIETAIIASMVAGATQATAAVVQYQSAAESAFEAKKLAEEQYVAKETAAGEKGRDESRRSQSIAAAMKGLGNPFTGVKRQESRDIALDTQMIQKGAKSEFLEQKRQFEAGKKQAQFDAFAGVMGGATTAAFGMGGGTGIFSA